MPLFFRDCEQMSQIETDNIYSHKNPKYPKSTTDVTFFEPTATRIANMKRSAVNMQSLYDFKQGDDVDISKVNVVLGRKPYFTTEEMKQIETLNQTDIKNQVQNAEETDKKNKKALADKVANTKQFVETMANLEASDTQSDATK